jgi:homoserine kinase
VARVLSRAVELEGHGDNVTPAVLGGLQVVYTHGAEYRNRAIPIPPTRVVVCVPRFKYLTVEARAALPASVQHHDAVFNIGRVAMFVAACAAGDRSALRAATEDRLHQAHRLAQVPASAAALEAALSGGAWAAWLSGSGPTVAALCEPADAERLAAAMPADGHVKVLRIDHAGVVATAPRGT